MATGMHGTISSSSANDQAAFADGARSAGRADWTRTRIAWANATSFSSGLRPRSNSVTAFFQTRNSSIRPRKHRRTSPMLSPTRSASGEAAMGASLAATATGMPLR